MIVSRKKEVEALERAYEKKEKQFVAIYGRRRVGKTYLVDMVFKDRFTFRHSGVQPDEDATKSDNEKMQEQLNAFYSSLLFYDPSLKEKPEDWFTAFRMLYQYILKSKDEKKVIFIDEIAWMDSNKSSFLAAFSQFYNQWLSSDMNVLLIVCASATTWILKNIIHNTGGMYNRTSLAIKLESFTLNECQKYAEYNELYVDKELLIKYYMVLGGIPYYWDKLIPNLSFEQNIDQLFFKSNASLQNEFNYLYRSMFVNYKGYINIVEALSKKKEGLNREEIAKEIKVTYNGNLSEQLNNLELCGIIRKYKPYGKRNHNATYKLIDNFTLFYYEFIKDEPDDENYFMHLLNSPKKNNWEGRAFEQVIFQNIDTIKKALGISGVSTEISSFRCQEDIEKGIKGHQIDLVISRKDKITHLCEIKFSNKPYVMDKKIYDNYIYRTPDFLEITKAKTVVIPVLISPKGIFKNQYASYFPIVIDENDLFY